MTAEFYASSRWKKFRLVVLAARPWCECTDSRCKHARRRFEPVKVCGAPGSAVDHLEEVRQHPNLALDERNVVVKCASCHSSRTARDHWHPR